jgi:hypothetical protein
LFEESYADKFGFREDEVIALLNHYNLQESMTTVTYWYNSILAGGGVSLYNPWSIMNFCHSSKVKSYWIETGIVHPKTLNEVDLKEVSF